ncbi:PepSY domain-containing protein [Noviherbaspirillum sp. CPCC 100848]|uniref:PepSY domain-containing protein n=1 Tax=Noviherbaspirillum album TaxID=3080276 RepID=A0ABU6JAA4_9BURK|nr:PepSY domain-containing protein [Noviherbaspirillum sp. CPCC 100848]MEC4720074.1 PepSY domain-containing protein [Noviherbaspirillum sp. CPCC 100848]
MAIGTNAKRCVFLIHRWTGVGMCILLALWFGSGIVMLFVGYPKLTPWERLGALPPLAHPNCCISPEAALAHSSKPEDVREIVLTSIRNTPHYVLREGDGSHTVIDALNGTSQSRVNGDVALAGAKAFMPDALSQYVGSIQEDRWTHSRGLDSHRPLHMIQMHDAESTRVYVSSATGQVVLDLPRYERLWNYAGAWLHWLYMLRNQSVDPVWTWTVIVISAIGVLTALTGVLNGIWRWRFSGVYKNGGKSPFRDAAMRWHHVLGLSFGTVLFLWIFSGLMSMNPLGIFDAKQLKPDAARYHGGSPAMLRPIVDITDALSRLTAEKFEPRELEWRVLNGTPYIVARDGTGDTRLLLSARGGITTTTSWSEQDITDAAMNLFAAPVSSHEKIEYYDLYYYKRAEASMYGSNERKLPVIRFKYDDPEETWVYVDMHTGRVELSVDRSQRLGRWLFNLMHSWDLPALLDARWWREILLVLLSLGGFVLSSTGLVISVRRIKQWIRQANPDKAIETGPGHARKP